MPLYCRVINVKPEDKEEYIRLHRNPRQEVRDVMIKNGMVKHAIFEKNCQLISVFEYTGSDYESDMKSISSHPAVKDWWEIISPMQIPLADRKAGEWWAYFEPVTAYGWEIKNTGENND